MNFEGSHEEVALRSISDLSRSVIAQMESKGITTANQVLEISNMPNGMKHLVEELDLTASELEETLAQMKKALSTTALDLTKKPIDVSNYGLGARLDKPK